MRVGTSYIAADIAVTTLKIKYVSWRLSEIKIHDKIDFRRETWMFL